MSNHIFLHAHSQHRLVPKFHAFLIFLLLFYIFGLSLNIHHYLLLIFIAVLFIQFTIHRYLLLIFIIVLFIQFIVSHLDVSK